MFENLSRLTNERLMKLSKDMLTVNKPEETRWYVMNVDIIGGNKPEFLDRVYEWEAVNTAYLYIICVTGEVDLDEIERLYSLAKAKKHDGRAYARLNNKSPTLYVGSSRSLKKRLKEHFGFGARGTSSLQISHWCNISTLSFEIHCAKYQPSPGAEIIQEMEDTMWLKKRPMFGRRGRR